MQLKEQQEYLDFCEKYSLDRKDARSLRIYIGFKQMKIQHKKELSNIRITGLKQTCFVRLVKTGV